MNDWIIIFIYFNLNKNKIFIDINNMSKLSKGEISDLDKWIEQLKNCEPLEECQVKTLCDKVNNKNIFNYLS